ncbi:MAG: ion transporter [Lachnospiraceae bacterium]|nr:ion transporter [Lachnospiraceae bacterium]
MKKYREFIDSASFQNTILIIIIINSIIMGLQTSKTVVSSIGNVLEILDYICLGIFIIEILLKLVAYGGKFFTDAWNWFDVIVVVCSVFSGLAFLKVLRVFRIFRVFRTLKALKGLKALRLVSRLDKLRMIIGAIGKSIPGISWTAVLLLLIYYIFGIIGVTLFGEVFPDWFGTLGKSIYTLFQVMTLESWSMGISRPVMEVFGWAWIYFVPFVLISSFVVMNVVVGIVVNSISEVQAQLALEREERAAAKAARNNGSKGGKEDTASNDSNSNSVTADSEEIDKESLKKELEELKLQIAKIEKFL